MTTVLKTSDFVWRGLDLHLRSTGATVLSLKANTTYPHLYHIVYPNGWISSPGNLTRAKDAAYGHARHVLAEETAQEGVYSRGEPLVDLTLAATADEAA